ncbi:FtsX-like permease family protein [Dactylosporangium sp. NPDC049140]|uniref:FtsX-like permease family protein n=1 Tax=Dactylosporangium sp. NPDC049140 TaxID=3155647 RepID=UPI0033FD2C01
MIRFGLRLALAGGREALLRFVVIAAAVALGTGLLVSTIAGLRAVDAQVGRGSWLRGEQAPGAQAADPVVWAGREDTFAGTWIWRVDVGLKGPNPPAVPGIPRLPDPGQYYVSRPLHDLIATIPADQLAARFPGHEAGIIDADALTSPDSLVAVIGRTPGEAGGIPRAHELTSVSTAPLKIPTAALDLVLSVVAGGLLFPLLVFVGTATRLSAARREQRFAAMRLIGATPRQVTQLAAVEAGAAAVLGTIVGFALFPLLRVAMAAVPFTTERFFPDDLSPGLGMGVLIALGVPLAAVAAAALAMRRVRISPLGVARQVTPKPPRAWRLIPVVAGLAELAYFIGHRPETSNGQTAAFLPGFLVTMVGLVLAGPWLTMAGARLLARRARRLPALVAARRLADNPQAAFRAISGVMLALFVVSVATGVITTMNDERGVRYSDLAAVTLVQYTGDNNLPQDAPARLRGVEGVTLALVLHDNPDNGPDMPSNIIACTDLARIPQYGRCAPGAEYAAIWGNLVGFDRIRSGAGAGTVWPTVPVTADQAAALPSDTIVVVLDGTGAALERARTALELAFPDYEVPPATDLERGTNSRTQMQLFQRLADVIMLFSLPIAGCSLAVSVAGGIADRKRPFSLLRLTGVPLRALRRVVALESVVPLLAVALLAGATGFGAAQLFLRAQMGYNLTAPSLSFYALVALGLAVSLAIIAATLPLLERVTGPETARNE